MKPSHHRTGRAQDAGPSQRQLRAGELVRHALAEILREEEMPDLQGASVTVTEVRLSPDLRHAICFAESLGGVHAEESIAALNRHAKFLRGRLGRVVDLKFTPDLKFLHDESFAQAERMNRLFAKPEIQRDLGSSPFGGSGREADEGGSSSRDADEPPSPASPVLPPRGGDQ